MPNTTGKPVQEDTKSPCYRKYCGKRSGQGVQEARGKEDIVDGHNLHTVSRKILLPFHDTGCIHKAGIVLCSERIVRNRLCA